VLVNPLHGYRIGIVGALVGFQSNSEVGAESTTNTRL